MAIAGNVADHVALHLNPNAFRCVGGALNLKCEFPNRLLTRGVQGFQSARVEAQQQLSIERLTEPAE